MHRIKTNKGRRVFIGFLAFAAVFSLVLSPVTVNAHSPSGVTLEYDMSTQTLKVSITHTSFSGSHYVNKVEIRKNGNLVGLHDYKDQTAETVTYSYKVTAAAGDTLEVKAYCNRFGSRTERLRIAQPGQPAPT